MNMTPEALRRKYGDEIVLGVDKSIVDGRLQSGYTPLQNPANGSASLLRLLAEHLQPRLRREAEQDASFKQLISCTKYNRHNTKQPELARSFAAPDHQYADSNDGNQVDGIKQDFHDCLHTSSSLIDSPADNLQHSVGVIILSQQSGQHQGKQNICKFFFRKPLRKSIRPNLSVLH